MSHHQPYVSDQHSMPSHVPFALIYERYQPLLYGTLKKLAIYHAQEDFLQEARLALWEAYLRFDPTRGNFSAYAAKYVRGRILTLLSKESKHRQQTVSNYGLAEESEEELEQLWPDLQAEQAYRLCELEQLLQTIYPSLSTREKIIIDKHILNDRPLKELAQQEQVSIDTVKTWKKRALKKIRQHLSPILEETHI